MDPTDPERLWTGGRRVWRTDDGAANWASASPVLAGAGTVSALAVTPAGGRRILVGKSDGFINVGVSADGNAFAWTSTEPRAGYVSSVGFHPTDSNVAYATYSTFGGTHVWKTTDGGANWVGSDGAGATAIPDIPCHSVVVDPLQPSRVYLGTDLGVFVSLDGGASWAVENTGFANVITESLVAQGADLYAFTHGRGAWRVPTALAVSIDDVSVVEGNSGTTPAVFNLSLSRASAQIVNIDYATSNGTAMAGGGTLSNNNPITIPSSGNATPYPSSIGVGGLGGSITKVTVAISGFSHTRTQDVDVLLEHATGFNFGEKTLLMSDIGGANPVNGLNLTFDDAGPALTSAAAVSGTYRPTNIEDTLGNDVFPGAPPGPYTASLATFNGRSPNGFWFLYVRDDGSPNAGQIAGGWSLSISTTGGDYVYTSGRVTFAPGVTSQTITVLVNGDTEVEPNETFFVNIGATGAVVADSQGLGTIIDDDGPQTRTIQFVAAGGSVGEASGPALAGVRVTTSNGLATTAASSVSFSTADGTATAGSDYTPSLGTISFPAGTASGSVQNVSVPITSDSIDEADETFTITLGSPSGATLGANTTATVTIIDDDPLPSLSVNDVTVLEGNAGFTSASFTVTLSPASGRAVTVKYATADGTATAPADYQAGSGTLAFNPGETSRTVVVAVNGDALDEADDAFFLNLSGAGNAAVADGTGQATITDDDPPRPCRSATPACPKATWARRLPASRSRSRRRAGAP